MCALWQKVWSGQASCSHVIVVIFLVQTSVLLRAVTLRASVYCYCPFCPQVPVPAASQALFKHRKNILAVYLCVSPHLVLCLQYHIYFFCRLQHFSTMQMDRSPTKVDSARNSYRSHPGRRGVTQCVVGVCCLSCLSCCCCGDGPRIRRGCSLPPYLSGPLRPARPQSAWTGGRMVYSCCTVVCLCVCV